MEGICFKKSKKVKNMICGMLKVALARKIVKDQCPFCGGPIVGAVDEHYQCRYCDNIVMGVVQKKA